MGKCDKWAILRILEVIFVGACLVFKRVTDDEAFSLFLYLQKLSREWSLLNNVTWSKVGSSVADATYGGYFVITCALLIGKLAGDLPTKKRVAEYVLLGVGAILFIVLGSLEFAAIDSLPHNLVDNAAILGTLSVIIGALFLLDLGAPKAKDPRPIQSKKEVQVVTTPAQRRNGDNGDQGHRQGRSITQQIYDIEREIDESERDTFDEVDESRQKSKKETKNNGVKNGGPKSHNHRDVGGPSGTESAVREFSVQPTRSYIHLDPTSKGYKQMRDEAESQAASHIPRPKFGIYGKDAMTFEEESETDDTATLPPKIELHNPVWSQLRKDHNIRILPPVPSVVLPPHQPHFSQEFFERSPSSPSDPGFVQYTAQNWGEKELRSSRLRTPKGSPTEEEQERVERRVSKSRMGSFYTGV